MADIRKLPVPVTEIWDWQIYAACRDLDTSMFFHPDN
jgi:WhiB family redox-sensing transcriptional regulator